MANNLSTNTTITSTVDALRYSGTVSTNASTTSSNAISQTVTLLGTSATVISTGGLSDVLSAWFYNDNTGNNTASIIQISGSTTALPFGTVLYPGYSALIGWSGSIGNVYAKVLPSTATASLQYIIQQS